MSQHGGVPYHLNNDSCEIEICRWSIVCDNNDSCEIEICLWSIVSDKITCEYHPLSFHTQTLVLPPVPASCYLSHSKAGNKDKMGGTA